ncbi:hypothetical protein D3C80_1959940 [compost metagenome]
MLGDALLEQQVIITKYFDEFAPRRLYTTHEVLRKTQGFGVAQITHRHPYLFRERVDNLLDLIIFAVITDDDFQVLV